jgi:hypothetical protein
MVSGLGTDDLSRVLPPYVFATFVACSCTEVPYVCPCRVLTCQSISLASLDCDHALGAQHLHNGIGSVDDSHEFQEERPP